MLSGSREINLIIGLIDMSKVQLQKHDRTGLMYHLAVQDVDSDGFKNSDTCNTTSTSEMVNITATYYLMNYLNIVDKIHQQFSGKGKVKILNVGCGLREINYLIHNSGLDCEIHNVEGLPIESQFLEALPNETYIRADFEKNSLLDFYDKGEFDAIISVEVMEHLNRETNLKIQGEIFDLLKDGGRFYCTMPQAEDTSEEQRTKELFCGHLHLWVLDEFADSLRVKGFKDVVAKNYTILRTRDLKSSSSEVNRAFNIMKSKNFTNDWSLAISSFLETQSFRIHCGYWEAGK